MTHYGRKYLDDSIKVTKTTIEFGPLKIYRVPAVPSNDFGRNGDLAIIDDTAVPSTEIASNLDPGTADLCQKIGGVWVCGLGGAGGGGPGFGVVSGDLGPPATATVPTDAITLAGGTGIQTTAGPGNLITITATGGGGTLPGGIDINVINGQEFITYVDTNRSNKELSIAEHVLTYSRNRVRVDDWINIGNSVHQESGYIADFDGTVVYSTGHCDHTMGASKKFRLYINNTPCCVLGDLSGGANASYVSTMLDTDFNRGDKIRVQAEESDIPAPGRIENTVIKLTLKWRA